MRLTENTLYADDAGKQTLAADKERLMDSLMINFFGFLGMYSIGTRGSLMKQYQSQEGKLIVANIGDANRDVSLAIKMAYDAGLIKLTVVNKMTRLLAMIKQRKLASKDIDSAQIRKFLDEIHYMVHRPSIKILTAIKAFHEEQLTIWELARDLYKISKLKEYKDISKEFRQSFLQGNYGVRVSDRLKAAGMATDRTSLTQPTAVSAAPAQVAGVTTGMQSSAQTVSPVSTSVDTITGKTVAPTVTATKPPTPEATNKRIAAAVKKTSAADTSALKQAKLGDTDDFYRKIFNAKTDSELNDAFKTYGVSKTKADANKVAKFMFAYLENANTELPHDYVNWPMRTWAQSAAGLGKRRFDEMMEDALVKHFDACTKGARFFDKLKAKVDGLNYTSYSVLDLTRVFNTEVQRRIASDFIRTLESVSDLKTAEEKYELFGTLKRCGIHISRFSFMGDGALKEKLEEYRKGFCLPAAFGLYFSYILPNWLIGEKTPHNNNVGSWINNIIPTDKMSVTPTKRVVVDKSAVDALPDNIKTALMAIANIMYISVVNTSDKVGRVVDIINDTNNLSLVFDQLQTVDVSDYDEEDIEKIASGIKNVSFNRFPVIVNMPSLSNKPELLHFAMRIALKMEVKSLSDLLDVLTAWKFYFHFANPTKELLYRFTLKQIKDKKYPVTDIFKRLASFSNENLGAVFAKLLREGGVKKLPERVIDSLIFNNDTDCVGVEPDDVLDMSYSTYFFQRKYNMEDYFKWLFKLKYDLLSDELKEGKISLYTLKFYTDDFMPTGETLKRVKESIRDGYRGIIVNGFEFDGFCQKMRDLVSEVLKGEWERGAVNRSTIIVALNDDDTAEVMNRMTFAEIRDMFSGLLEYKKKAIRNRLTKENVLEKMTPDSIAHVFSNSFLSKTGTSAEDKEYLLDYSSSFSKLREKDAAKARNAFTIMPDNFKKRILNVLGETKLLQAAAKNVGDGAIKPLVEITDNRIREILAFNNVKLKGSVKLKTLDDLDNLDTSAMEVIEDLKVEAVEASEEEIDKKTIEYDKLTNGKHGDTAVKIIREFNVNIPVQETGFEEFKAYKPNSEIIDPAFHGTGSIAASMILRYGFAVIKSGDESVVGRMLGDGIYFSTVLDKVAQYVSDGGYSRGKGNRGYIFQMKAVLGDNGKDYRSAGQGGDYIRSPEWCVFDANRQLKIYKAFEVELVSKGVISDMKAKYNLKEENTMKLTAFREFIKESDNPSKSVTSFIFVDGTIPVSETETVDFEEFVPGQWGREVTLEPSAYGPQVYIEHDGAESECYCVSSTFKMMTEEPKLLNKFLTLIGAKTRSVNEGFLGLFKKKKARIQGMF